MKTTAIYSLACIPALILAAAPGVGSSIAADNVALQSRGAAVRVAQTPLVLNDFDRSAVLRIAATGAAANLTPDAIVASLVGPRRITLPRAGGTTTVPLDVQGLTLGVQPVSLPAGVTVSLSGNQLSVVSTANRTGLERVGSVSITGLGQKNPRGGRVRGVLQVGLSQLPCTTATCPAAAPTPPAGVAATATPTAATGIDWSAVATALRSRDGANAVLVVIDGSDSANRTSGAALTRIGQLCAANSVKCILEPSGQANSTTPSQYFLSPAVHAALYGTEAQLLLSLRGEQSIGGNQGAISQLRAAGLGHTVLVSARSDAAAVLAGDSYRNVVFAADSTATASVSARVPTVVVPQALVASTPLAPVDFEINGQAFVADRSMALFDAAGGSVSLRFLQTGGLRWAIRKVPNGFVQGGSTFPQSGNVTLTVGPSSVPRSEQVEFSAKTADGAITLFIDVRVIQDPAGAAL